MGKEKDLLGSRWATWLLWIAPVMVLVGTGSINSPIRTIAWTFAFTVAGVACLVNARRCGRLHCFYTGPLYLLAALSSLLYGLGLLPLGRQGWNLIFGAAAVATLVAYYGLERLFGKYVASREPHANTKEPMK